MEKSPKGLSIDRHLYDTLKKIDTVSFTQRELDIISFYVCGRSVKKIASVLGLSVKTVENHTHNVLSKLDCCSREYLLDFVERVGKLDDFRMLHEAILLENELQWNLRNIERLRMGLDEGEAFPSISKVVITAGDDAGDSTSWIVEVLGDVFRFLGWHVRMRREGDDQKKPSPKDPSQVDLLITKSEGMSHHQRDRSDGGEGPVDASAWGVEVRWSGGTQYIQAPQEVFSASPLLKQLGAQRMVYAILSRLCSAVTLDSLVTTCLERVPRLAIVHGGVSGGEGTSVHEPSSTDTPTPTEESSGFDRRRWIIGFAGLGLVMLVLVFASTGRLLPLTWSPGEPPRFAPFGQAIRSDFSVPKDGALVDWSVVLDEIDARFSRMATFSLLPSDHAKIPTLAIHGPEGAGKSVVASLYAEAYTSSPLRWMLDGTSKETLLEGFKALAQQLKVTRPVQGVPSWLETSEDINPEDLPPEAKVISYVKQELRKRPGWLLIFDNLNDFKELHHYLPVDAKDWGHGRVLITTSSSHDNIYFDAIPIGELTSSQKMDLFKKLLHRKSSQSAQGEGAKKNLSGDAFEEARIKAFLTNIPSYPLDITLAAYYISQTNCSLEEYLLLMEQQSQEFSSTLQEIAQQSMGYNKTRLESIALAKGTVMQKVPYAEDLLFLISAIDAVNIPRDLLERHVERKDVGAFLRYARRYYLVKPMSGSMGNETAIFGIHPTIQKIVGNLLKHQEGFNRQAALEKTAVTLRDYMRYATDNQDFYRLSLITKHAERFIALHGAKLPPALRSGLMGELGCVYCYLSELDAAKKYLFQALGMVDASSTVVSAGAEGHSLDPTTRGNLLVCLGNQYRRAGHYQEAKQKIQEGLLLYDKANAEVFYRGRALGYLGVVQAQLGDYDSAISLLQESLRLLSRVDPQGVAVAWNHTHLGRIYYQFGEYEKAEEVLKKAVDIFLTRSTTYAGAAWALAELGYVYTRQRKFADAERNLEESFRICTQHFQEGHDYVARSYAYRGVLYGELKRYDEALAYLRKAQTNFELKYGSKYIELALIAKHIGEIFLHLGQFEEAKVQLDKAQAIYAANDNPNLFKVHRSLGDYYLRLSAKYSRTDPPHGAKMREKAKGHFLKAIALVEKRYGPTSKHLSCLEKRLAEVKGGTR